MSTSQNTLNGKEEGIDEILKRVLGSLIVLEDELAELKSEHAELKSEHAELKSEIPKWDLSKLRAELAADRGKDRDVAAVQKEIHPQSDDFENMVRKIFKLFKNGPVLVPTFDARFRQKYRKSMKDTLGLEDKKITDILKELRYINIIEGKAPNGPNTITYMMLADNED